MKIKTKIFALIGALAAVTITVAGVGIETLKEYNASVENVKNSAGRALYSERLNRLVTAVVMDSRGIYASGDTKEAKKFADGVKGSLADIDSLLKRWEPLVLPEDRALFDAVVSDAASFKSFRTETARLGTEVSPEAANTQGNNDANRANRKKFQASIDALTTRSQEQVTQVEKAAAALYDERLLLLMVLALGGTAAALVLGGVVGHRQIARPLQLVTSAIERLAAGDYNLVQARHGRDEIGDIWKSMGVFASTMKEAERLRAAQTENELEVAQRRKDEMAELASRFEGSVGSLVQHLSTAAQELEATAQSMATTANQTNQQSSSVAAAAEETSVNVQAVASATEELAASAGEIGSQVLQTSHVAKEAVEKARRTDERVQVLAEGAQKVGQVIALINQIAAQTNLLALNATIEAARAGEAGKGFAVVASEVKELANQTARATDDITAQIAEIQTATSDAVESIREIGATIAEMHQIATSVAAAVEQQKAATHEIARNVSEAARGTQEVTQNIVQVQGASTHSGAAAAQVLTAASEMARNSTLLAREVDAFLGNVRAA